MKGGLARSRVYRNWPDREGKKAVKSLLFKDPRVAQGQACSSFPLLPDYLPRNFASQLEPGDLLGPSLHVTVG